MLWSPHLATVPHTASNFRNNGDATLHKYVSEHWHGHALTMLENLK